MPRAASASSRSRASTPEPAPNSTMRAGVCANTWATCAASADANSGEISGAVTKSPPAAASPNLRAPAA